MGNGLRGGVRGTRPLEAAALKATIVEPEAVMVPPQQLDLVSLFVAKDEPGFGERIEIEGELHEGGQAVDGLAHVGRAAGQMDISDGSFG